jgi:hypothetical protein
VRRARSRVLDGLFVAAEADEIDGRLNNGGRFGDSLIECAEKQKGRPDESERPFDFNPGSDLRSHAVTSAVSSALRGLTSVFGMGTGVTPAVRPPGNLIRRERTRTEFFKSRKSRVEKKLKEVGDANLFE